MQRGQREAVDLALLTKLPEESRTRISYWVPPCGAASADDVVVAMSEFIWADTQAPLAWYWTPLDAVGQSEIAMAGEYGCAPWIAPMLMSPV